MNRCFGTILSLVFGLVAIGHGSPSGAVDASLGYACAADARRFHGGHFGVAGTLSVLEPFHIRTRYGLSEHRSKGDAFTVHQVAVGGVFDLDVFHYVPWAGLSAVAYMGSGGPASESPAYGMSFDVGFDRLLDPHWAIGFAGEFHQVFGEERFPAYMLLGVRISYRFTWGDAFKR